MSAAKIFRIFEFIDGEPFQPFQYISYSFDEWYKFFEDQMDYIEWKAYLAEAFREWKSSFRENVLLLIIFGYLLPTLCVFLVVQIYKKFNFLGTISLWIYTKINKFCEDSGWFENRLESGWFEDMLEFRYDTHIEKVLQLHEKIYPGHLGFFLNNPFITRSFNTLMKNPFLLKRMIKDMYDILIKVETRDGYSFRVAIPNSQIFKISLYQMLREVSEMNILYGSDNPTEPLWFPVWSLLLWIGRFIKTAPTVLKSFLNILMQGIFAMGNIYSKKLVEFINYMLWLLPSRQHTPRIDFSVENLIQIFWRSFDKNDIYVHAVSKKNIDLARTSFDGLYHLKTSSRCVIWLTEFDSFPHFEEISRLPVISCREGDGPEISIPRKERWDLWKISNEIFEYYSQIP